MTSLRRRSIGLLARWLGPLVTGASVVLAVATCAPPPPGGARPLGREPRLRVALVVDADEVRIRGQGTVAAAGSARFRLLPGEEIRVLVDGAAVRVEGRGVRADRIVFRSLDRRKFIAVNGRPYRGLVEVYARNGTVLVVNELGVEAYLPGVVNAEMGSRTRNERAALEAQAIVSRTYALKNRGRFRADGYDIRAGVSDQAYLGVERETSVGVDAVRSTVGLVVSYRGDLISPFFFSTCGYSTASPEEAFRTVRPVPYLRPVSDRQPSGGYYCDISPRFRWTVEWEGSELRDILRRTVPSVLGVDGATVDEIRDVRVHAKGPSGRVTELRVGVGRGEIPIFGPDVRRVLETPDGRALGSTAIELVATRRAGRVAQLTVSGAAWGHGLGMCQWGAVGRARAGQSARTIVTTYFPGARIERWY